MRSARAASLCSALSNVPNTIRIQTSRHSTGVDDIKLVPRSLPSDVLDPARWSESRIDAAQMLLGLKGLERYSPLELRLLVGLIRPLPCSFEQSFNLIGMRDGVRIEV